MPDELVPERRIRLFKVAMAQQAADLAVETLMSGYIGQGPKVDLFEAALDRYLIEEPRWGKEHVLTTNSCTSALDLALELIGVGPGDKVITTPQTCTATNSPIVKRGAIPVWADIDVFGLISPASVRTMLYRYPEAKAVVSVDWAGRLPNVHALRQAAKGVPILQDAAHRFGGLTYGDYVAWSFQAIKFLTTGDGGALLTPPNQYERAKLLRWYGLDRESSASFRCAQNIGEVGFKYHMNDIAASVGLGNIRHAWANRLAHQANAAYLCQRLGIGYDDSCHYWFFPLTVSRRDEFITYMDALGIDVSQVHARNDKHDGFNYPNGELPGVDWFDSVQVGIPCGWWLTKEDLDRIADAVLAFGH